MQPPTIKIKIEGTLCEGELIFLIAISAKIIDMSAVHNTMEAR
jgi:hypothetical protein